MIAYYAHAHGSGHVQKAELILNEIGDQSILMTSYKGSTNSTTLHLPDEDFDEAQFEHASFKTPPYLHYSPVGNDKITRRVQLILNSYIERKLKLLIVDVSVEIAAFARSASIPYAYVRLFGDRTDLPHEVAFHGAVFLIAYFPKELEPEQTPDWVKHKTLYFGFFSSYNLAHENKVENEASSRSYKVLIILGSGGTNFSVDEIDNLTNDEGVAEWTILGNLPFKIEKNNVKILGKVTDISQYVKVADAVLCSTGLNLISELVCLGAKIIGRPEVRPFKEQKYFAESLERLGLLTSYNSQKLNLGNLKTASKAKFYINAGAPQQFSQFLAKNQYDFASIASQLTRENKLSKLI